MTAPTPAWTSNFSRRAGDPPGVVAVLPSSSWSPRQIGSRWSGGHAIVRDPDTGTYEERNPPMGSEAEQIQSALLTQRKNNRGRYWYATVLLLVGLYFFCRVMWP